MRHQARRRGTTHVHGGTYEVGHEQPDADEKQEEEPVDDGADDAERESRR